MKDIDFTRRQFMAAFSAAGLSSTLLPGVLWAQTQSAAPVTPAKITDEQLKGALAVAGLQFNDEDRKQLLDTLNKNLERLDKARKVQIPDEVMPPIHFSALVPGMLLNKEVQPFQISHPEVKRPANLDEVAFWRLIDLAQLVKTRKATSVELTQMYLARLKKHGGSDGLNCVVTLLEESALAQAKQADAEIAAGKYRGPLHGIPWGVKDLFTVKGYKTTWGSSIYKDQVLDYDATIVELLAQAGAVLLAKLSTAELAAGDDYWFGGQTKNPWNTAKGTGGSSSGSGAATAAGLVGFAIGTETNGSIIWPSSRCGVTGLRPTFGRSSRYGAMPLAWSYDRPGPMCRYAEDCAVVMKEIARVDHRDLAVVDVPFNWNAKRDVRSLKIGYLKEAFDEITDPQAKSDNERLLAQVRGLGITLRPVALPDLLADGSAIGVEAATFFDGLIRSGRDKEIRDTRRVNGTRAIRLVTGADYLNSQRIRMMLMMKLAQATQNVDAYITPIFVDFPDPKPATGAAAATTNATNPAGQGKTDKPPQKSEKEKAAEADTLSRRHAVMANMCTYPALALPCGFDPDGMPQSVTFFARPFKESELLTLGKAYQDATGFHLKHPKLSGDTVP